MLVHLVPISCSLFVHNAKTPRTKQNYLPHAWNYVKQEAETIDTRQEGNQEGYNKKFF